MISVMAQRPSPALNDRPEIRRRSDHRRSRPGIGAVTHNAGDGVLGVITERTVARLAYATARLTD
jgi:hypothetical protein